MMYVEQVNFEYYKLHTKDTTEPWFKKMTRGVVEDGCETMIRCAFIGVQPLGFIATKHYKNYSNLKWVGVLPEARGKGAFRLMCEEAVADCWRGTEDSLFPVENYFRVSINGPALEAYRKIGFKICGEQKSDCYLSAGRLTSPRIEDIDWTYDTQIEKWMNQQPRGGCIVKYKQAK